MYSLWEAADRTLREAGDTERAIGTSLIRELKTDRGATIALIDGELSVSAEFETPKGTNETVEVAFAEDIRDLADSRVHIAWDRCDDIWNLDAGKNTAPLRDYPKIAGELLALI